MVTTIRIPPHQAIEFLLGGKNAPTPLVLRKDMTPGLWLELIDQVMQRCGPILKYLPGFTALVDQATQVARGAALPLACGHFNPRTWCRWITELPGWISPLPDSGIRRTEERALYLSRNGEWVISTITFESDAGSIHPILWTAGLVDRSEMRWLCETEHVETMLARLGEMLDEDIDRREREIADRRALAHQIGDIFDRLS